MKYSYVRAAFTVAALGLAGASGAALAQQTPSVPVTASVPGAPATTPVAQAGQAPGIAPGIAPGQAPATKSASPEEANPFSNVKTTDDKSVKQELPVLEQRLKSMEDKMSAIQQVQVALPADALGGPGTGGTHAHGAVSAAAEQEQMELETATFVACVNGKALFRDSDQKPFFVDAKEASQNEAVRRIGGCKH